MTVRRLIVVGGVVLGALSVSSPASAHFISVNSPGAGTVHEGWVGGGGAAHVHGLVNACQATAHNHVVNILAPPVGFPNDDPCQHGVQRP